MSYDISVVIPLYNESANVSELMSRTVAVCDSRKEKIEILCVDDGSTDGTFEALGCALGGHPHITVIRLRKRFGQTAAFAAGFDYARGDIIVTLDGDLQNFPEDIPRCIDALDEGYDVASGWRRERADPFLSRLLPSRMANALIAFFTGLRLHDYGCSLKAYRALFLKQLTLYGELHRFMPALLSWQGARIKEIEVRHAPRKHGKSKYNLWRTLNVVLDLITVRFMLSLSRGPMQLFGRIGVWATLGGFASLFTTLYMKYAMAVDMTGNPFLYLSVIFVVAGLQFFSLGLLGEIIVRIYGKSVNRKIYSVGTVQSTAEEDTS